jgi:hypothetical protein
MKRGFCIVCQVFTTEKVKPFGMLTEPVWCHHEHDNDDVQRAWMEVNGAGRLEYYLVK